MGEAAAPAGQTMPGADDARVALELVGVSKFFRRGDELVKALDDVDLRLGKGEFVSIVGKSGSGKSTLLYLAGGFSRPDRGRVMLAGADLATCSNRRLSKLRRTRVGFVFQFFHLLPNLTVYENVALPLVIDRSANVPRRVDRQLQAVGLSHRRDHRPGELSGGEMQRTAIARSLVIEPTIVIADEPTGNLDSAASVNVMEMLRAMVHESRAALLLVTHDPGIAGTADRTVRLDDGRVVG
jgi:putative ABC transport system ATP-binding protein